MMHKELFVKAKETLECLISTARATLERKCCLGHNAPLWQDNWVVIHGDDAMKTNAK